MKIALAQTYIEWEDKKRNIENLLRVVSEHKGKDYIFFPEMSFTGFSMNTDATAEDERMTVAQISGIARENNVGIGFGWVKRKGDKCLNCYSVVNKQGELISEYAKIHPFSYSGEDEKFVGGDEISVFSLDDTKATTFICYDLRFPEIFRLVSQMVKVIIIPANWPKKRSAQWKALLKARAIENQVYIFAINCVGRIGEIDYSGDSCIIGPDGKAIKMLSEREGVISYDFADDVDDYRESFPVLKDMRRIETIRICSDVGLLEQ